LRGGGCGETRRKGKGLKEQKSELQTPSRGVDCFKKKRGLQGEVSKIEGKCGLPQEAARNKKRVEKTPGNGEKRRRTTVGIP